MANCSESVSQQASEINVQNFKTILDRFAAMMAQGAEDNQKHSRAIDLIQTRRAENAATFDHALNMGFLQVAQTGSTENQQTVSPADVAVGEVTKGGVAVAGEQVAANIAALGDVVVKLSEAMSALETIVLSQTQPRSPAAASPTPGA